MLAIHSIEKAGVFELSSTREVRYSFRALRISAAVGFMVRSPVFLMR
jgi:hypothetical protein